MSQFILHIGPHKTGTTYLQLSFRALRSELADRGTVFPEWWEFAPGNPSMLPLARQLAAGDMATLERHFAALVDSGQPRILLSAEDLSDLGLESVERLRVLTAGHEVRIVFYARRWCELIPSGWQENIKHGHRYTLPEFVNRHFMAPEASRLLNFDLRLAPFAAVFGVESLDIVSYSELRDRGIDLVAHFAAAFLEWPEAPLVERFQRANVSRDMLEVELLRGLHAMARARGFAQPEAIRRAFDRMAEKRVRPLLATMERHIETLTVRDDAPPLQRLHDALMARYGARIMEPAPAGLLFTPGVGELRYVEADYLAEPGASAGLRGLFDRVAEEIPVPT